jgi:dTDP-4-amino-4,6-dideoxygalactose transaminase
VFRVGANNLTDTQLGTRNSQHSSAKSHILKVLNTSSNPNSLSIIPHSRPTLGKEEIRRVVEVMESGHISQGEKVREFESAFAARIAVNASAAVSSGTAALHLTLLGMDIGDGDEVIMPSFVCSALLNAVHYTGATPVPADIHPQTYNLDPDDVKKRITVRTRAIIVPHLFGLPADLDALCRLDIPIIEDCAQAVGSTYKNRAVGVFGHAAIFSFYATKVMTTGEGGMIVSGSKGLIDRVRDLREYDNCEEYKIRYNYKMTDIQAAIGLSQLERLGDFIGRRRKIAEKYYRVFKECGLQLPPNEPGHIYYRFVIDSATKAVAWIQVAAAKKIICSQPVHNPLHRLLKLEGYPNTEQAWQQSISVPIYPSLNDKELERIIDAVVNLAEGRIGAQ